MIIRKANILLGKRKPGNGFVETIEESASLKQIKRRVKLLETKFDQADLISVDETEVPKKTLLIMPISPITREYQLSTIINFFQHIGLPSTRKPYG